jgi:hypothetical protein
MRLAVLLSFLLVPQMANAICEIPLVTDSTKVAKTGDTMTGSLIMSGVPISLTGSSGYINSESSITTLGMFFGPLTGNVTGNCSGTAGSLAATPTAAPSGYVSRGVDASGNAQTAWVESAATSGSTNPITSGAAYTALGLKAADSAVVHLAGTENITGAKAFQATGNGTYSLAASSGISVGQDVQVTGTVQANKFKGDGSQLTGIGGGGTVTTQGSPAAGYMAAFQGSSAISTAPYYVTPDSMTALVPVSFSTGVNIAQYAKFSSSAPSASMGAGAMWLDSSSGRINYLDANNLQIELDPAVVFATTYSTGTVTRAIGPPSNDKLCFTPGHHSFSDGTPGLGCADALGGLPFGISGTVKRLTCWHSSALGASNTWTLRKNGSSTGNACTDSAIAASCSVSESLVIVSTDIVSVQQTAGATLTNGGCMIAVVPGVQ